MTNNVCLYHGIDLDGFCSGAIYAKYMEQQCQEYELIPANYGWDLPWEKFEGAHVTLIDFSLQPASEWERLALAAAKITWIDHHKSAIDEWTTVTYAKLAAIPVSVARAKLDVCIDLLQAGCELAWRHYFPGEDMPDAVRLLGRYDVWDHGYSEHVLSFQYGMRLLDLDPASGKDRGDWATFLDSEKEQYEVDEQIVVGEAILKYQRKEDATGAKALCYPIAWRDQLWLAANRGGRGSTFFDSQWNAAEYAGMISYSWNGERWTVGLYTDRPEVDCGAIAKEYGGGGHPGAAGFQAEVLPFQIARADVRAG